VLAGWSKRPTHIVTVNDYLAQRDADWLRPVLCFLRNARWLRDWRRLMPKPERASTTSDVTYTTSKELLADFLRDRLRLGALRESGPTIDSPITFSRAPRQRMDLSCAVYTPPLWTRRTAC